MENNPKQLSDKEMKKEMRRLKREAKEERRYGNPAMMKLAENDPGVRPYYERYKRERKNGMVSLVFCAIFLVLGIADLIMLAITQDGGWASSFGIEAVLSLFWLQDFKISDNRADLLRHEFVQYANAHAVIKTVNQMAGKEIVKDESDKAKKVD